MSLSSSGSVRIRVSVSSHLIRSNTEGAGAGSGGGTLPDIPVDEQGSLDIEGWYRYGTGYCGRGPEMQQLLHSNAMSTIHLLHKEGMDDEPELGWVLEPVNLCLSLYCLIRDSLNSVSLYDWGVWPRAARAEPLRLTPVQYPNIFTYVNTK
ncbi:hypothetical protein GYMLUDRAFT_830332 [Collybiopsis luxurians FD-317 M1]|uniref:Uncharacterized protein n=1 Tax=Collybiopsis luxurians FD-317 M1 TaxID=944289 RepID=A0A0D0CL66_9AGAR|nr:hypothetical protein GYMLUDRAFT_830332 [Collybiopsis luxurians FD-317 M1]